jgi:hypothetical protein
MIALPGCRTSKRSDAYDSPPSDDRACSGLKNTLAQPCHCEKRSDEALVASGAAKGGSTIQLDRDECKASAATACFAPLAMTAIGRRLQINSRSV